MIQAAKPLSGPVLLASATALALALGCTGVIDGNGQVSDRAVPGAPNAGNGAGAGAGATSGSAPGVGGGGAVNAICEGTDIADNKRVVRLTFNQISRTLHSLLGDAFGAKVDADYEIGSQAATPRTFPPLASPQEGSTITTGIWQKVDLIANQAGAYTLANLNQVTGCGATPTDACAKAFVLSFAEKAYRHPLSAAESSSLSQVYDEVKVIYGTIPEAVQNSIYAVVQSPQLLYRTEVGTAQDQAGPLTAYELASSLAYFLTDAPPDADLLSAAQQNRLATPADIGAQVDRILALPVAKTNFQEAVFSYFQLDNLASVKIDDPAFTSGTAAKPYSGVRESAYHEVELFLANTLWSGPLTGILTARKSRINTTLAQLYGLTIPAQSDEGQFVEVDLPANRGGLLTQVGFLASNSRPDVPSVVARGLVVNKSMLCQSNPSFPTDPALVAKISEAGTTLATASERERSDYRLATAPCNGCHRTFDAYGLALDNYDNLGRYRTMDPEGRPINTSVTLPALFDNQVAKDTVDMQQKIAENPGFAACFSRNMLNWSLAEGSQLTPTSCATQAIVKDFNQGDKSLSSLLHAVAISKAFTNRNAGAVK
ncbi:MAG: DUF1592 domain-containing protein [Polyangiaceae bacterium]